MKANLNDSILWTKRGVSVIWDAPELAKLGTMAKALSLRQWFRWKAEGWPDREHYYTGKDKRTIIVAGLDAALEDRHAAAQRHVIAVHVLHQAAATGGQVVDHLRMVQPQVVEVDDVDIGLLAHG